jgi:mxaL protein
MRFVLIFKKHYDLIFLVGSLILLLIAVSQPSMNIMHQQKNYLFVVDVTQSMNVQDMKLSGKPISRLEYAKQLLKDTLKMLPCDSRVGLGIFFKTTVLYTPIETCSNYHILWDTIDHLDWRMASQGSSNIRIGLLSISSLLVTSNSDITHVIFMTDGQEAQPLNIFTKVSLTDWQAKHAWLIVGLGGNKPAPIPKLNTKNEVIGYWSTDAIKLNPASNVDEGHNGGRDNSVATEPYEYYLSQLDESYLKELSSDIGAQYIKAGSTEALISAINKQPSNMQFHAEFALNWAFALAALLLFIARYFPDIMFHINKRLSIQKK